MSLRRIFAVMALVLVVAPLVANAPLFDPDEGLHAAIAQEMNLRHDYVTPSFLGEPFLDKPILFFWAEALSLRAFGDRELAVRLPPLLFGVLGMLGVAALGRAVFDESTGLLAGIVYGTMLLPLAVSQVAVHDVAVVPFLCAACAVIARGRSPLLAGAALGLSILTKGLVAVAFTGLFTIALVAFDRRTLRRAPLALTIAGVVAVLVALPWYLAMEHAHPGYLHYYFIERHLQGYLTATQRHAGRGWWYYLPIVIGGSLPWTGYLAGAARSARAQPMRLALWTWFALGVVFLSAGESKLVTYILPVFPSLALLVADAIVAGRGVRDRAGFLTFAVTLTLVAPLALGVVAWKFSAASPTPWLIVGFVAAAIAAVSVATARSPAASLETDLSMAMRLPVMALCGLMVVTPRAAAWMTARDLAAALNAGGVLPSQVSVVGERIGSLVFYLAPPLRAAATPDRIGEVTLAQAVSQVRVQPADAVVAVRDDEVGRLSRLFGSAPPPDVHAGTFTIFRAGALRASLSGSR
jgi:4-amino-4-deoxy-L-arabinose transferase-like glycosyltransferase